MFSFSTALTTLNRPVTTTTTSTITFAMISQTQLSVRMRFRMRMRMRHLDRGTGPKAFRLGLGRVWEPDYAIRCDAIPAMMGIRRLMGRDCDCTHREWMYIKCNQLGQVRRGSQSDISSSSSNNNNNIIISIIIIGSSISIFIWSGTKRATTDDDGLAQKQQQQHKKNCS